MTYQNRAAAQQATQRINRAIIAQAGARRVRSATSAGARPPASIAGPAVDLCDISDGAARVTPIGYKTARRQSGDVLDDLGHDDPRRRAAILLADSVERIGASAGSTMDGGGASSGISDGGATTRVKHAARLAAFRMAIEGPAGEHSIAMPVLDRTRNATNRGPVLIWQATVDIATGARSLSKILRMLGWSDQTANRRKLRAAVLAALDRVVAAQNERKITDNR